MENENSEDLTKKEKNEALRKEKQKIQDQEIRAKKVKRWIPWIIFVGLLIGGVYWIAVNAEESNESRPGEDVPIVSRDHINVGDEHEAYNSNPPTSGPHAGPAPWGFNDEPILDENAIHNLEHGGIWITYKDLDEDSIDTLRKIANSNRLSVLVSPREEGEAPVSLASWGRLETLDSVDTEAITEFIRRNKNKSPEQLAR